MAQRRWFFSVILGLAMAPALASAASFYGALGCKPSEAYLLATNLSSEAEPFWLQNFGSRPFTEKYFEVPGKQAQIFSLAETFVRETAAVAVKTRPSSQWQFQTFCKSEGKARPLTLDASPWKHFEFTPHNPQASPQLARPATVTLSMVNLSQQTNPFEIRFYSQSKLLQSLSFNLNPSFQRTDFTLKTPPTTDTIEVHAKGRWTGFAKDHRQQEFALVEGTVIFDSVAETRYFLMRSRSDSNEETFVVPLNNPKLIAESLEQIANPEVARLLVAKIEKGFHGANRDLKSPSHTPWSWQVSEALQYADFAKIGCDGNPGIVEERLDDWIASTGGVICFWNYRVDREVSPEELRSPQGAAVTSNQRVPVLKLWGLNPLKSESLSPLAPVSLRQTP